MARLAIKDIVQILDKEIMWCEENPDKALSADYRKGFVNGLIQSKYLITEMNREINNNQGVKKDDNQMEDFYSMTPKEFEEWWKEAKGR